MNTLAEICDFYQSIGSVYGLKKFQNGESLDISLGVHVFCV